MLINQREHEVLSDLIGIDSVNPKADPSRRGEQALVDYLADLCRRIGLEVEYHEVTSGRPNLIAYLKAPQARGRVLYVAHTDTVPPGDMPDPFTARVIDGRMMGRGAVDDKGCIVSMLAALEQLAARRHELTVDVLFAAVIDEESESAGAKALAAMNLACDGAVILEGTSLQPVIAHRGSARLRLRILGRAAHSSRPDLGINAISHAAALIHALDTTYRSQVASRRHPLAGPASVAVTRIAGGVTGNMIPPLCTLTVNRRFIPGETQAMVFEELAAVVSDLQRSIPDFHTGEIELEDWDEALDTPIDAPIAQAALAAVRAVCGSGEVVGAPWGSDAPIISKQGIPCVVLGPGAVAEEGHTMHESVPLEEVVLAARIYAEIALQFAPLLGAA
jgi:acetylornithine deacetylase